MNIFFKIWTPTSELAGLVLGNVQLLNPSIKQLINGHLNTHDLLPFWPCGSIGWATVITVRFTSWGPFLESPETFRAYFGRHNSLCIFKTKASRGTKLCRYFDFYSLYNIWKDQLNRISGSGFYEWLFGTENLSGLSRNGPLFRVFLCPCAGPFPLLGRTLREDKIGNFF